MGVIFLILTGYPVTAKAWTRIQPDHPYFTNVRVTTDSDIYLMKIRSDISSTSKSLIYDVQNHSLYDVLDEPTLISSESVGLSSYLPYTYTWNSTFIVNRTYWLLFNESGSLIINVTIPSDIAIQVNNYRNFQFLVSVKLDTVFLVVPTFFDPSHPIYGDALALLITVSLGNSEIMNVSTLGNWKGGDGTARVYDEEGVVYFNTLYGYPYGTPTLGYWYRFSTDFGIQFLTSYDYFENLFFDTRTSRIIRIFDCTTSFSIINYDFNSSITRTSIGLTIDELNSLFESETSKSSSDVRYFPLIFLSMIILLLYRRKKKI